MVDKLNSKMVSGFKWMSFSTILKVILQFIFIAILARLIGPEAYGIQAISMLIISTFQAVSDGGIGKAIIHNRQLEKNQLSTLFYLSIIIGFLIFSFINIFSPYISIFFNVPELVKVLSVLSAVFLIRSFSVVAESVTIKEMNFKPLAIRNLLSYVIANLFVGIPAALYGLHVWSLVLIVLSNEILRTFLILKMVSHSKSIYEFNLYGLQEIFRFGSGITLSSIFNKIAINGDTLIIGKFVSVYVLGLYSRAYKIIRMPANLFGNVISTSLFPALSSIQDENERIRFIHYNLVLLIALIFLPISVFISMRAELIINILFGKNWMDVAPILEILSLGLYLRIGYKVNGEIIKAKGLVFNHAIIQMIYALVVLIGCYIGQFYGVNGISFGILFALLINFFNMSYIGIKASRIKISKIIKAHYYGILLSMSIFASLSFLDYSYVYNTNTLFIKFLLSFFFLTANILIFLYYFHKKNDINFLLNIFNKKFRL